MEAGTVLKTYMGYKEMSGENMIHIESFLANQKASDSVSANQRASDR